MSIRRRLLIILLFMLGGIWLLSATANYFDSRNEVEELLDAQLKQSAEMLLVLSDHDLMAKRAANGVTTISAGDFVLPDEEEVIKKYTKSLAFQVWIDSSILAVRSANAPAAHLSPVSDGFSNQMIGQEPWRIYSISHKNFPLLIQVGERYDLRDDLTRAITLRMLTPVLVSLPIIGLIIWFGIEFAMRPLYRIANEVAVRETDHLDPVDARLVPDEAKPLVHSLNTLLIRVQKAFESERRFTADAAHELRTPLAAIKAQAQVAQKTQDAEDRQRVLQKVVSGVDNATRVVQQLLILARIDPATPMKDIKQVDLCYTATMTLQELAPLALKKDIEIGLSETCRGIVHGNADTLSILLANLVHNAINYTPPHGTITVDITTHADRVQLSVCDSGPGIPAGERDKVMRRFYRGRDVTQAGSGLGLSIVARIVELHRARVVLGESTLGGLQVDVLFPLKA
jgi:two-component system sensor histidine kinase QseC